MIDNLMKICKWIRSRDTFSRRAKHCNFSLELKTLFIPVIDSSVNTFQLNCVNAYWLPWSLKGLAFSFCFTAQFRLRGRKKNLWDQYNSWSKTKQNRKNKQQQIIGRLWPKQNNTTPLSVFLSITFHTNLQVMQLWKLFFCDSFLMSWILHRLQNPNKKQQESQHIKSRILQSKDVVDQKKLLSYIT